MPKIFETKLSYHSRMSRLRNLWDRAFDLTGFALVGAHLSGPDDADASVLDVPGYRQTQSYTCGFVAGLMVLHTFKPKANVDRFYTLVEPHPEYGTTTHRLITALNASGVGVGQRNNLTFDALASNIENGFPIITTISHPEPNTQHWIVLYGVGRTPKRVFLAGNGVIKRDTIHSWREFRRRWAEPDFGLVCWGR